PRRWSGSATRCRCRTRSGRCSGPGWTPVGTSCRWRWGCWAPPSWSARRSRPAPSGGSRPVTERETAGRPGDGVADAVQATAYLAAACRAREAARAQPRLTDPYAARFASLADQPALHRLASSAGEEVVARTVLLDRLLGSALSQWEQPLVVNLGAGFCTRPYRLDLSACRLVLEVDAAPVLAVKERVLAEEKASCPVIRSPGDVTRLPELVD